MSDKSRYSIVRKEFYGKAVKRGNILLFNVNDAIDFIKRCQELNIRILGIDSFKITGEYIQPFMEHSPDYSLEENDKKGYWAEAEEFIKSKESLGYVFEIVADRSA